MWALHKPFFLKERSLFLLNNPFFSCEMIVNSQMLLCVDSVPLHIASAVKTPVVALFGPSSELNWGPWMHPQSIVLTEKMPCRPCFKDGCAGSKMSDCLFSMQVRSILSAIKQLEIPCR